MGLAVFLEFRLLSNAHYDGWDWQLVIKTFPVVSKMAPAPQTLLQQKSWRSLGVLW